jgi:4-aminobutyrate aminotransferase-like enzyme
MMKVNVVFKVVFSYSVFRVQTIWLPIQLNISLPGKKFLDQATQVIDIAFDLNRPIGCFISEIIISSEGMIVPPAGYLQELYKYKQLTQHFYCLMQKPVAKQ